VSSPAPSYKRSAAASWRGGTEREDSHLRNFFLIIPALTLSFVDSLRNAKDRLEKTVKGSEAYFTDDGFALGLAYILAILKQDRAFESLHWWDAVSRHHAEELARCAAELATLGKSKPDADKREELEFKRRRIAIERREFEALYYAYRGGRSFFREAAEDEDEDFSALV
jgi:WASH complex subunit 7